MTQKPPHLNMFSSRNPFDQSGLNTFYIMLMVVYNLWARDFFEISIGSITLFVNDSISKIRDDKF